MSKPTAFLCISTFYKGMDFLKACRSAGNTVYLLTNKKLQNEDWPWESINEVFYLDSDENAPENLDNMLKGVAWLMRSKKIDRIVALDDFDVEKASYLREAFRIPGMGQTTSRHFRDKLAMRMKAEEAGLQVPAFCALFNDDDIQQYTQKVSPPWLIKPRSEASATGIKKIHSVEQLWQVLEEIGEDRHRYLLEQFKPGDVYHVDSLSVGGKAIFTRVSQYLNTPFEVAHGGGVFLSHTVEYGSDDDKALQKFNADVLKAFGMQFSASHTEFIKNRETGEFYFLETSSRVGGAHLAEMVEASSGINLWGEWAKIESAMANGTTYQLPKVEKYYTGILVSLSRYEWPDMSSFNDEEIVWKINKKFHVGLIVRSKKRARVLELLHQYAERIAKDFHAAMPAPDKSTH